MKNILNKTKVKLNKKSKLSKNQTKRKNKKSLKSVKRIQKGGVANEEVFGRISEKTGIDLNSIYPACLSLIGEFSQSPKQLQPRVKIDGTLLEQVDFWSYEAKIKATSDFERIFEDPLGWYQHKNPKFKILKSPTPEEIPNLPFNYTDDIYIGEEKQVRVPEYRFLVAQMIKDLLLALYLGSMPQLHKNNKEKNFGHSKQLAELNFNKIEESKREIFKKEIFKILSKIEQNIKEDFKYVEFIDYMSNYLNLFSSINFDSNNKKINECIEYILYIKKLLLTPFIIFPTLIQINLNKTLNLIKAPLLNFRLSNSRKKIHSSFDNPCSEIEHDILQHCGLTHNIYLYINRYTYLNFNKVNSSFELKKKDYIFDKLKNLEQIYILINMFFRMIISLFNYFSLEKINKLYTLFLFVIFHEKYGINIIFDNNILKFILNTNKDEYTPIKTKREEIQKRLTKLTKENYDTFAQEKKATIIKEIEKILEEQKISIEHTIIDREYDSFMKELESILTKQPILTLQSTASVP